MPSPIPMETRFYSINFSSMETSFSQLPEADQNNIERFREIITANDPNVEENISPVMGGEPGFVYEQEGVFKYALVKGKRHFTFHNMAMYANPEVREEFASYPTKLKFMKGCINFTKTEYLTPDFLEKLVKTSAAKDFSPVINHYKTKK